MEKLVAQYTVPTKNSLSEITDFIHDRFFGLDEISLDSNSHTLTIPFWREMYEEKTIGGGSVFKSVRIPVRRCVLRIHNVVGYTIEDTEKVGSYDFESIQYDEQTQIVTVATNIPLDFSIHVSAFKLSAHADESIREFKERCSVFY